MSETEAQRLKSEVDSRTKERIYNPVVFSLYDAYVEFGMLDRLVEIVNNVPSINRPPLVHTLSTHVTKEKPVLTYLLAPRKNPNQPDLMGAVVDVLWSVSLMYDDMVDKDTYRAGVKSAWVVYGQSETEETIRAVLEVVFRSLSSHYGERAALLCQEDISLSIGSITRHQSLKLDCNVEELLKNYAERAAFHTHFPISLFYQNGGENFEDCLKALVDLNIAGQILNDLKDFSAEFDWQRDSFSDLRNGLVSLPLKILWDRLGQPDRGRLGTVFGKAQVDRSELAFLWPVLLEVGALTETRDIAKRYFKSSFDAFRSIVGDSGEAIYYQDWIRYKLEQLEKITNNLQI